jgi:hypothetical protein
MRSGRMLSDMNWVMKQLIEDLKNEWNAFTYGMVLAIAEEKMKIRREELVNHGAFSFTKDSTNESEIG